MRMKGIGFRDAIAWLDEQEGLSHSAHLVDVDRGAARGPGRARVATGSLRHRRTPGYHGRRQRPGQAVKCAAGLRSIMRCASTEWGLVVSGVLDHCARTDVGRLPMVGDVARAPVAGPRLFLASRTLVNFCLFSHLGDDWKPKTTGIDRRLAFVGSPLFDLDAPWSRIPQSIARQRRDHLVVGSGTHHSGLRSC